MFVQEIGKRIVIEGHFRVLKQDRAWKVDDMITTAAEGVTLPSAFSFVDEAQRPDGFFAPGAKR